MAASRRLNKEVVVKTAAQLIKETGALDDLTLTNLAKTLEVRTPSLYNHIDGLDGLYRDLTIHTLLELTEAIKRSILAKAGADALIALAHSYRNFVLPNAGLYELITRAPDATDEELVGLSDDLVKLILLVFDSYGLSGETGLHAVRGLRSLVHGFVSLEIGGGFGYSLSLDESFDFLVRNYVRGLKP